MVLKCFFLISLTYCLEYIIFLFQFLRELNPTYPEQLKLREQSAGAEGLDREGFEDPGWSRRGRKSCCVGGNHELGDSGDLVQSSDGWKCETQKWLTQKFESGCDELCSVDHAFGLPENEHPVHSAPLPNAFMILFKNAFFFRLIRF